MLTPLGTYVVIEEDVQEDTKISDGGVFVPTDKDIRKDVGTVIASSMASLKEGDRVMFKRYGFEDIEYDGKPYLVGKIDSVIAKL